MNDKQLQDAVLAELAWEPSVVAAHVGVTANAGVVTLTGHVATYASKMDAADAAARVKGVKAVAQEIEVKLPSDARRSDDDIAAAVIQRLSWDVSVPRDSVRIRVQSGWVTLTGEVEWFYQKQGVADSVRRMFGVTGVSNDITLRTRVNTSNISDDIMRALGRSWFFDPQTVSVTANGGRVTLNGSVHSFHDREVAAETAWGAPGTTDVENHLAVVA